MAELRRRAIGIVFQNFNLIPSLSALENVLLPTFFDERRSTADRRRRTISLMEQVGLGDRMHHRPMELSGGQQQRVAIARALVNDPVILSRMSRPAISTPRLAPTCWLCCST